MKARSRKKRKKATRKRARSFSPWSPTGKTPLERARGWSQQNRRARAQSHERRGAPAKENPRMLAIIQDIKKKRARRAKQ